MGDERSVDDPLLDIRLSNGRPIWCRKYLTSYTYEGWQVRTPSERNNTRVLEKIGRESEKLFGDWPLHIIQPSRDPNEIDYPHVRITSFFTSLPMNDDMHLSSLVIAWFQNQVHPIPDEDATASLQAIPWEKLAVDYIL